MRPVVIRFGAFGDMVMLLPLLRQLAEYHQQPVDLVTSGGWARQFLSAQSCVGELQVLSSRKAPYWFNRSQQDFVRWLREAERRPVYLCETDEKSHWLVRRAGVAGDQLHWAGADPMRSDEHWIERWMRLGRQWTGQSVLSPEAIVNSLRQGWLELAPDAAADCDAWIAEHGWQGRKLVLLQPGSKRTMRRGAADRASNVKYWPEERWAELSRAMLERHADAQVLICGSPEEQEFTQAIEAMVADARVQSVAHELPLMRLLALLARAHSMVSVDTGPAHAAAALNCPLVVLFAGLPPARWRPYAVDGEVTVIEPGDEGLRVMPSEGVIGAWKALNGRSEGT